MKKRIISLALVFILAFSLLPTGALAASSKIYDVYQGDGFYITVKPFTIKSNKYTFNGAFGGLFHDGMLAVKTADVDENWVNREFIDEYNFVDTDGNILFPEGIFHNAECILGDKFAPSEGMIPYWDGKTVTDNYDQTPFFGYVDYSGKVVIPCKYKKDFICGFSEGLAQVGWHFIDNSGRIVIDEHELMEKKNLLSDGTRGFSDGLIRCVIDDDDNITQGYMDKSGNMVLKLFSYNYNEAEYEYYRDYWKMYVDGKTDGYLKPIRTTDYIRGNYGNYTSDFSEGYTVCFDLRSGNWRDFDFAIIDTNGNVTGTFSDAVPYGDFHDGLLQVLFIDNRGAWDGYGYVDTSGNVVFKLKYGGGAYYNFSCGLVYLSNEGGLVDTKFNIVIPEGHFGNIRKFNGNLALGYVSGSWNTPSQYYVLEKHEGTYTGGGSVYNHAKGGEQTTKPTAPTTPTTSTGFGDVADKAWYAAPVKWAVEKGITTGTSKDKFSPNSTCNNAQILTFLWRAAGKPGAPDAGFADVASGAYYADAANWAKSKDMISGDKLSPETPCTRASAVMYIWQAMGKPEASKAASFTDVPANADYADAVAWAVEKGVTNGTGADTFSPGTICTRAQIVTFLQRAYA